MAFEQRSLEDYIDVAQRIADFRAKYPEGTLTGSLDWTEDGAPFRIVQAQGFEKNGDVSTQTFIVYVALAYRSPDDRAPGMGVAWEIFPGRTPYTRGSELQNAETSAWGRAIIAVGASDSKRGIASREEVRNRQAERDDGLPANADGSLSRSRTTDAEKAAAGVMTDAEQRAHNQLAKPPPNTGKVERWTTSDSIADIERVQSVHHPVDNPWYDSPAPLADLTNPEDRHGTATADQIRSIQAAFTAKGIKDRDEKIAYLRRRCGDVNSSRDLSYSQAAGVLQELAK